MHPAIYQQNVKNEDLYQTTQEKEDSNDFTQAISLKHQLISNLDPTAKFEQKLLVYIVISDKGTSNPIFRASDLAVNQKVYLNEALKKKVIPFIKKYHSDGEYIFWPDLATSHYAKTVTSYLTDQKINFVQKEDNPDNLPECRPIEDYWGILKDKVYEHNWQAKNLDQLRK